MIIFGPGPGYVKELKIMWQFLQLLPFRTVSLAILFLKKIAPWLIALN